VPLPAPEPIARAVTPDEAIDVGYAAPAWSEKLTPHWEIGEAAAQRRLIAILDERIGGYPIDRDRPDREGTSRLSPHLAFGEISPRQVWHASLHHAERHPEQAGAVEKFVSELGWRDFHLHQLFHRANIAEVAMQPKYDALPWRQAPGDLNAWQRGETGIPIVDAGMRELWATGYMHNRVRMLAGSLLTKNLMIDWRAGERWFWDTLCDADAASNPGNWQWVAGCGLDAAPYFRIFNPALQGEKFDPDGRYVRKWVPELGPVGTTWVHRPWDAPAAVRREVNYPEPIVDLSKSRARALEAFETLRPGKPS
jgi:deoxyribodipyrimidine photo-lyase